MVVSEVMEIINFLPADILCFILGIAFLLVPAKLAECTRRKRTFPTVKCVSKSRGGKKTDLSDSSDTSCLGSTKDEDGNTTRGTAFSELQVTLSKLTPEEAAKVHEFLKAKQAAETQRSGWNGVSQSNRAVRPFTPFQGPHKTSTKGRDAPPTKSVAKDAKDSSETMRSSLYELSLMDSTKVLMVRKVSKLGSDAARLLEVYFSRFGPVERCLASATRATTKWGEVRLRPATVAFLVMTSEAVKTILDYDGEHRVEGVSLSVCPFQSHSVDLI